MRLMRHRVPNSITVVERADASVSKLAKRAKEHRARRRPWLQARHEQVAHLSSALDAAHEAHVDDEPRERQEQEHVQVEAAHVLDALRDVQRAPVEEVLRAAPFAALRVRHVPRVERQVTSDGRRRLVTRPLDATSAHGALQVAATRVRRCVAGHREECEFPDVDVRRVGAVGPETLTLLVAAVRPVAPRQRVREGAREVPETPGDEHVVVDTHQETHLRTAPNDTRLVTD